MPELHLPANQRRCATARPERRECARLRNPGPITLRETRLAYLRIPIADSACSVTPSDVSASMYRKSGYGALQADVPVPSATASTCTSPEPPG